MLTSLQCVASSSFKLRAVTRHSTDQAGIIKRACLKAVYCFRHYSSVNLTTAGNVNSRILLPSNSFSASHKPTFVKTAHVWTRMLRNVYSGSMQSESILACETIDV